METWMGTGCEPARGPAWELDGNLSGNQSGTKLEPNLDQKGVLGGSLEGPWGSLGGPLGLRGGVPLGPNWDPGLTGHRWGTGDPKSAKSV